MSEINIPVPAPQLRVGRRALRNTQQPREAVGLRRLIGLAGNITTELQNAETRRNGMQANLDTSQAYKAAQFDAIDNEITPLARVESFNTATEKIESDIRDRYGDKLSEEDLNYILQLHGGRAGLNVSRSALMLEKDITKSLHTEMGRDIYGRMIDADDPNGLMLVKEEIITWGDKGFDSGVFSSSQRIAATIKGKGEADRVYALTQIDLDPVQALKDLRDKENQYNDLDEWDNDERLRLIKQAETAIGFEARGRDKQLRTDWRAHIVAVEMRGDGQAGIWNRMLAAGFSKAELSRFQEQQKLAKDFFSKKNRLGAMPILDREAEIDAARPKNTNDRNFDLQQQHYERLLAEGAEIESLERNNPVRLALRYIDNPSDDQQALMRQIDNYYDNKGVPGNQRQYLLDGVAGEFVRKFDDATVDGKVGLMIQMKEEFGDVFVEKVFEQLQNKGMPFAAVAYRDAPVSEYRQILESQRFTSGDIQGIAGVPADKAFLEEAAELFREGYGKSLTPGGKQTEQAIAHNNALQKLTGYLAAIKGDPNAADTAYDMLFGKGYVYDGTMRIPIGFASSKPAIVQMARDIQESISGLRLYRGGVAGNDIPAAVYAARVESEGVFHLNDSETGYDLFLDDVPVKEVVEVNGIPVNRGIRFSLLEARAKGNPVITNVGL